MSSRELEDWEIKRHEAIYLEWREESIDFGHFALLKNAWRNKRTYVVLIALRPNDA